ncbi:hypothetical protein CMO84_03235 [Candidatus Woesearchaeota archaeon]|nr:hypothetical protein [Candidatus Woesearchaeota archaeon]
MFFKRRWFKILAILLGLFAFVGYFTFSTFLFPPHEDDWEFDVSALVPRDVDFFVAKSGLEEDFGEFPRLAAANRIERTEAWMELESTSAYGAWLEDNGVEQLLAQLDEALEQIPLGYSPLDVFGGSDLALAGRFKGQSIEQADWAVYGRLNWIGKAALGALNYPGLIGLDASGLVVTEEEGILHLAGGQLSQDLYIARVLDVGVLGSEASLVRAAVELERASGENSLYLSADYGDRIETVRSRSAKGNELEVLLDLRALLDNLKQEGPLPDTSSERFLTAFLGRVFQVPACRKVMGVVGFDDGVNVDLHGTFSSEEITAAQRRIYGRDGGFGHEKVLEKIAISAPEDAALFAYLEGPIATLLEEVLASVDPAMKSNLADAFRSTGRFSDLDAVRNHLAVSLHNRLALIVRENDYPLEEKLNPATGRQEYAGPPNDGQPVFAVALVTWYSDEDKLIELRELIGQSPTYFGLEGRNGENGYYKHKVNNFDLREFWSRFVPGTGVIATINTHDQFIISNRYKMLMDIYKTTTIGGREHPRLSSRPEFLELLSDTVPSANILVWMDPQRARKTLESQAEDWAREHAATGIDWGRKRAEEENKLIPQLFPGRGRGQLTRDQRDKLNAAVDPILTEYRTSFIKQRIPDLVRDKQRQIAYSMSCTAFLALIRLEPRSFSLSLRTVFPLPE